MTAGELSVFICSQMRHSSAPAPGIKRPVCREEMPRKGVFMNQIIQNAGMEQRGSVSRRPEVKCDPGHEALCGERRTDQETEISAGGGLLPCFHRG